MVPVNVSLFQAAAALDANSRWQEIIADNLASSSVPGYKQQQLSQAAMQAGFPAVRRWQECGSPFFCAAVLGFNEFHAGRI